MKFLIVDDDPGNLLVLHGMLKKHGQCDLVSNARLALGAFQNSLSEKMPYDLILLDIMMPEMDGHACLAALREIERECGVPPGKEVRVAMVSALRDTKNVCKAFFQGQAVCYIPKPVMLETIDELISSL